MFFYLKFCSLLFIHRALNWLYNEALLLSLHILGLYLIIYSTFSNIMQATLGKCSV